jgi:hypothetical protein
MEWAREMENEGFYTLLTSFALDRSLRKLNKCDATEFHLQ